MFFRAEPQRTGTSRLAGCTADGRLHLVDTDVVAFEVADRDLVIDVADAFNQPEAGCFGVGLEVRRDVAALGLVALFAAEPPPAHFYEVDAAIELGFDADGDLDRDGVAAEALNHHLHGPPEIGAGAVIC